MFAIYLNVAVGLTLAYVLIIRLYMYGWRHLLTFQLPENSSPKTKITVIIPARNEAENIEILLQSLENQSYSKDLFEVIIVNDHSEDATVEWIEKKAIEKVKVLHLADYIARDAPQVLNSYKKKAIEYAMQYATGDLIVQTDADCLLPPDWLTYMAAYYEAKKVKFIAAPVAFYQEKNSLERFQSLDFMGMMCITGAGIDAGMMRMCNGANLAYEKAAFEQVGGFQGIDDLASGDDMFLLHKMAKMWPNKIGFLKNKAATVLTQGKPTLSAFMQQRLRWATKNASYTEWQVTAILAVVFFFCWSIIISFVLMPIYGEPAIFLFFGQLLVKAFVDYSFLGDMARWFGRKELMRSFWSSQFMHILYIAVIGVLGNFKRKYVWKGREVE